MSAIDLRPRVADLVFHLYDQPLHPELFEVLAHRRVERQDFSLTVRITRNGHVISWDSSAGHLTEVTAAADTPLPDHRARIRHVMRGERNSAADLTPNLRYQSSFQVETLPGDVFQHVHDEILRDGLRRGLMHNFLPHHRLALSPLALITTEHWSGNLVLSTFHTFPEERTIVKTQSLIELLASVEP